MPPRVGRPPSRPTLVFDGDCGFCRYWIARWRRVTGDLVEYAPYQEVAGYYPEIPVESFAKSVQLILPDGGVTSGAEAVFGALATAPARAPSARAGHAAADPDEANTGFRAGASGPGRERMPAATGTVIPSARLAPVATPWGRGLPLWLYRRVPLAARVAEAAYGFVAARRPLFSRITRWLWGKGAVTPSYHVASRVFLVGLGATYLIAFASLALQIKGLAGRNGVMPIAP